MEDLIKTSRILNMDTLKKRATHGEAILTAEGWNPFKDVKPKDRTLCAVFFPFSELLVVNTTESKYDRRFRGQLTLAYWMEADSRWKPSDDRTKINFSFAPAYWREFKITDWPLL
jgi:hypothetical protein